MTEPHFRWPAEWESHESTWLSWPWNPETWPPPRLKRVETAFVEIVEALLPHERVCINVAGEAQEQRVRSLLADRGLEQGLEFFQIPTNDAWIRDHGPVFVECRRGHGDGGSSERVALDFGFNAWGGKYPPWDLDDRVPAQVASALGISCVAPGFVLEAGSIDGNGAGCLLATESCLLNANREVGVVRRRERMEQRLEQWLGARSVLWLGDGIAGDDTDGHVDDLTRFVDPGTVVTVVESNPADANYDRLAENRARLSSFRDPNDKALAVVELPMPPAIFAAGHRLPASYVNFYLANGVVLVPIFDAATDERALAVLAECLPGRDVVPIPALDLVFGLGAVHCLTQQEPRAAALRAAAL